MHPQDYDCGRRGSKELEVKEAKGEAGDAGSTGAKGNLKLLGVNIDPKEEKSTEDSGYLEKQALGKILDGEDPNSQRRPNYNGGQGTVEKQSQQQRHPKGPGGGRRGRKDLNPKCIISDIRRSKGNLRLPEARIKSQRRP